MPEADDGTKTCEHCGATIYPDHMKKQTAALVDGKLLCPFCIKEARTTPDEVAPANAVGATEQAADAPDFTVSLVEDEKPRVVAGPSKMIHGFSSTEMAGKARELQFKRPLLTGQPNATRCKTFHCKMTDASIIHMNEQINEWVDQQERVEIKFATTNIGVIEGKHADPHLVVTIFY